MHAVAEPLLEALHRCDTLAAILRAQCQLAGDRKCVTIATAETTTELTYDDILLRARRAAECLIPRTQPGDRVLVVMPTTAQFIDVFFGCLLSGRIAVPLPPEKATSRFSRIKGVIDDCAPTLAVFSSERDRDAVKESLGGLTTLIAGAEAVPSPRAPEELPSILPQHVAFIQYTSGSTSDPKGVVLTHANLVENIRMIQRGMRITPSDRIVSWLPIHHDMGLIGMLLTVLCSGARTRISPYQEFVRNPLSWLATLASDKGTLTGAPSFAFDLVSRHVARTGRAGVDLSSLRLFYCGSERIAPRVIERFYSQLSDTGLKSATFFPCYGLAEAALYVSGCFRNAFELGASDAYPTCGRVADGLSLRVVGDEAAPSSLAEGHVHLRGPSISPGYWKSIRSHVDGGRFTGTSPEWLDTGDLGFQRDGEIFITGRSKDLIKLRGRNIHPEDVELAVETLEEWFLPNSVVAVSATSAERQGEGITLIAEVKRESRNGDFGRLLPKVQEALSGQEVRCERLVLLSPLTLPKTSSGKKRRSWTAQLLSSGKMEPLWDSGAAQSASDSSGAVSGPDLEGMKRYAASINLLLADERRTFPADFIGKLRELRFLSLLIPKEYGGVGLSHAEFARVGEELGRLDLTVGALVGNHNTIGVLPILRSTRLPDKADVLRRIAAEGLVASFAITEPGAGSSPRNIAATVSAEGGKLFLSGEKIWIGNASVASFVTVFAKERDAEGRELGISAFLLRAGRHGYRVGEEQLTLGLKAMSQNRLFFDRTEVREEDRLSAPGHGLALAFQAMEYARFGLLTMAVGAMKFARERVVSFAVRRPIWTGTLSQNAYFQTSVAEMDLRIEALEALTALSAELLERQDASFQIVSMASKILAGEWLWTAVDTAVQFCGGRGYTENFHLARTLRDARVMRIFEGPTESMAYQLGAVCLRSATQEVPGDRRVSALLRELAVALADTGNVDAPKEMSNVLAGLYAAEYLAWNLLLRRDSGKNGVRMLLDIARSRWSDGMKRYALVTPAHRALRAKRDETGTCEESPSLYERWNGSLPEETPSPTTALRVAASPLEREPERRKPDVAKKPAGRTDLNADVLRTELSTWLRAQTRIKNVDSARALSEYGVDSLMAYEMLCFIEDEFNVHVAESLVMERPSIDQLAKHILEAKGK